ncbi:MAG: PspA/IM30 family protein [Kocuria sp.]|nr:PspA/IM30 family protein [Kocuria sp.]
MSAKQSLFGRISQLVKADVITLVDSADDPYKMLYQMIRTYTQNVREAESMLTTATAQLRLLEQDHAEDLRDAQQWSNKAFMASNRADEFRMVGRITGADKFDHLAKVALQRQMLHESEARRAEPQIAHQSQVVNQLKTGLTTMHRKLRELSSKREELDARQRRSTTPLQDPLQGYDIMDPISDVSRFEQKIRREEYRAMSQQQLPESALDHQFETLETVGQQPEVDARLSALKHNHSSSTQNRF